MTTRHKGARFNPATTDKILAFAQTQANEPTFNATVIQLIEAGLALHRMVAPHLDREGMVTLEIDIDYLNELFTVSTQWGGQNKKDE